MKFFRLPGVAWLVLILLVSCQTSEKQEEKQTPLLFELLPADQTGVEFLNKVEDGEEFNILTYRNFYNGGGVAVGDINNDDLPDIFFTSNMEKNRLYLNKGGFVFEDITEKAGIAGKRKWSTGVTMADVNTDGLLDIYVCNSGDVKGDDKENELFINNGDLTFTERGAEFNLNNKGFSTHASFFDYDLDGDLDCYILNNSFVDPGKIELFKDVRTEVDDLGGDKLYRNDGGKFTDVTVDAGIYSSKIGFGLGVSVSDVNNDRLPDIYISNDFWERDYLYINQGNGKFKERLTELLSICSISSMGADIADINNDGNPEIFTTDMLPADNYRLKTMTIFDTYQLEAIKYRGNYHYQILQNCLHLNNGNLNFQEVASFSGVSATDWSWGALMFDFENDGMKDIFVSNGIARDIMYVDFTDFIADRENVKKIVAAKGKFDWRDFIPHIPSNPLKSYGFSNRGNLQFTNRADELGLGTPSFSNGAAYGDLDNDGDLDLVVNNVNMTSFIYKNRTEQVSGANYLKIKFKGNEGNKFGIGASVTIYYNGQKQVLQNFPARGFQSSTEPLLTFGLGEAKEIETVEIVWPDKKVQTLDAVKSNQTLIVDYVDAVDEVNRKEAETKKQFVDVTNELGLDKASHKENLFNDFSHELLSLRVFSTEGPELVAGDVNGDKLDDFVLLGAMGDPDKLFVQRPNGTFASQKSTVLLEDSVFESTCGAFVDLNNDGDLDLIIGSGGNEYQRPKNFFLLRIYLNDGKGNFKREAIERIPQVLGNFGTIAVGDFDKDGYQDVFAGSRIAPGFYGVIPRSYLFRNINGTLVDYTPNNLGGIGMVTDAVWSDYDHDNDPDLIVVGDWMPMSVVINDNGILKDRKQIPNTSGWWNSIEAADLDGDGDDDYVLGNWGLNTKFKASSAKPLTMYVKDFDGNGKSEFIINWYPPSDQQAYPFATKPEMMQQMPALKKTNLKYEDYSHKTYESLLPPQAREKAVQYQVDQMQTVIAWNDKGNFSLRSLSAEAQYAPVFAIGVDDFDGDGIKDIWLGGNFYGVKPQVGRHDSSHGCLLRGMGNQQFEFIPPDRSGIYVKGEVRDAKVLAGKKGRVLLVARNNQHVKAFKSVSK
jgi:hypothetical protein